MSLKLGLENKRIANFSDQTFLLKNMKDYVES